MLAPGRNGDRRAPDRDERHVVQRLVVADIFGIPVPELTGTVGAPTLHRAAVGDRAGVIGPRRKLHDRRQSDVVAHHVGMFVVADVRIGRAVAEPATLGPPPAANLAGFEQRTGVLIARHHLHRRATHLHRIERVGMLVVADRLLDQRAEPPGIATPPATDRPVVLEQSTRVLLPARHREHGPADLDLVGLSGRFGIADVRGVVVPELAELSVAPAPDVAVTEGSAGELGPRAHVVDRASDVDEAHVRGRIGHADRQIVAVTQLPDVAEAPTLDVPRVGAPACVLLAGSDLRQTRRRLAVVAAAVVVVAVAIVADFVGVEHPIAAGQRNARAVDALPTRDTLVAVLARTPEVGRCPADVPRLGGAGRRITKLGAGARRRRAIAGVRNPLAPRIVVGDRPVSGLPRRRGVVSPGPRAPTEGAADDCRRHDPRRTPPGHHPIVAGPAPKTGGLSSRP